MRDEYDDERERIRNEDALDQTTKDVDGLQSTLMDVDREWQTRFDAEVARATAADGKLERIGALVAIWEGLVHAGTVNACYHCAASQIRAILDGDQ